MWSDTLGTAAGLVACESALGDDEGAPWMKNLVIGAGVGASSSERRSERMAALSVLAASEWWSGFRARGRDTRVAGFAMAASDICNLVGLHVTSRNYVSLRRRFATLMDEATTLKIEQTMATAAEVERGRQQQLLHQATIEVLKAIATTTDRESASRLAQQEAGRLRHVLRTKGEVPSRLDSALYDVCEDVRQRGLNVELVTAELTDEVDADVLVAARGALQRALLSALELGKARRAVVRATSDGAEVQLTVRDRGVGFTPGGHSTYEGQLNRLAEALSPIQGGAEVWSALGAWVRTRQ